VKALMILFFSVITVTMTMTMNASAQYYRDNPYYKPVEPPRYNPNSYYGHRYQHSFPPDYQRRRYDTPDYRYRGNRDPNRSGGYRSDY
jgi:hypothetical protein